MKRSKNAQTKDRGFTLTEMLVTIIVAGVLAAITAPSLVGLLNRNQVNEAQRQVESALKEAQRQAIRRGKSCDVVINPTTKTISSTNDGCLLSQREVGASTLVGGDKVSINANDGKGNTITFSRKGIPDIQKVIVINSSFSNAKKCVAIIDGLGTVKTGTYTGSGVPLELDKCNPVN